MLAYDPWNNTGTVSSLYNTTRSVFFLLHITEEYVKMYRFQSKTVIDVYCLFGENSDSSL
jgi:hypothetical protein